MEKKLLTKKSIHTYGQSSGEKIRTDKRIWQAVEITNKETDKKCDAPTNASHERG